MRKNKNRIFRSGLSRFMDLKGDPIRSFRDVLYGIFFRLSHRAFHKKNYKKGVEISQFDFMTQNPTVGQSPAWNQ